MGRLMPILGVGAWDAEDYCLESAWKEEKEGLRLESLSQVIADSFKEENPGSSEPIGTNLVAQCPGFKVT